MKNQFFSFHFSEIAQIFVSILVVIVASLMFNTVFMSADETIDVDSTSYHLPLAEEISKYNFTTYEKNLLYYPASFHVVLAGYLQLPLPAMWFNSFFSLAAVFCVAYYLGRTTSLSKSESLIYAFAVTTLTPLIRVYNTFKIDTWFVAMYLFVVVSILKVTKQPKSTKWWLLTGVATGALMGAKYTGIVYLAFFPLAFIPQLHDAWKQVKDEHLSFFASKGMGLVGLATLFGGIWYLRNWIITGDPLYPRSDQNFGLGAHLSKPMMVHLQDIGNLKIFAQAFFSEYLIWGIATLFIAVVHLILRKRIQNPNALIFRNLFLLHIIAFLSLVPFFGLGAIVSDMRYIAGPIAIGILYLQLYAQETRKIDMYVTIVGLNALPAIVLSLQHQPKLIILVSAGIAFLFYLRNLGKRQVYSQ